MLLFGAKVRKKSIESEWENLVCLMAHKYPLMKPLLLLKSKLEVQENIINVFMKIRGADFLKARKLDREMENVVFNLFQKKYTINIEESLTKEEENALREKAKKEQELAIKQVMQEAVQYNNQLQKKISHQKEVKIILLHRLQDY